MGMKYEKHEREEILGIVAEAMNTVLKDDDIDNGINKALEIFGRGTSVDRIYVFKNHWDYERDLLAVSQKYEWVNEGIKPEIDNPQLQNLPYKDAGYERWVEYLSRGEVITGLVDEFPESEKEILQMQGIKSMLVVPIIIKKSFWGLIGFDDCTNGKEWSVSERDILTAAASNIGNIIKKHETEKELKLATQKAKEASRAKSEFLSNMSHEIRTPLNIIIGMTEVLMESEISEEERRYIEIVKKSGSTLLDLVNDVLDLSKIESGNAKLNMSRFCLKTMITETSEMLKVRASEKGIAFEYEVESDVEYNVEGDKEKIRQVIINILGNAIKFTEEGEVSLKAKVFKKGEETYLSISISDSGIGISDDEMENIFKSFVQVDSQRNKKYSGTGLGLSISKSLVEMMGGKIWVESEVSEGSTFHFEVPVNKLESPEAEEKKCDYDQDIDRKLKILLVDDSQDNRLLIKVFLKKENCVIIEAENGLLGVESFERENDIDVILMDMQMPVMDGYKAVRVIREMEKTSDRKRVPIIALTAYAFKEDEKKSLEAGCDYHLTKPIKKDALIAIINRFTK